MVIKIEIDENELRQLVLAHLESVIDVALEDGDVLIQVKSAQNFRSEWETARFRATVDINRP